MSATLSPENTAVVMVTYGERASFVEKVVEAITNSGFARIYIVDNGSPKGNREKLQQVADDDRHSVSLLRLETNTGSAGGFRAGIELASQTSGVEYIWLLDDDNKPSPDAFDRLIDAYSYFGNDPKIALMCLRESRQEYVEAVRHGKRVHMKQGAFLGFSLKEKIQKKLRVKSKFVVENWLYPLIAVEYAPYGGLLFSKEMQQKVGLPNAGFFLYSDDHEYTMRWPDHDGTIYLCSMSQIEELEESWGGEENNVMPILIRPDTDEAKLYYFVRNRVYLEKKRCGIGMAYWGNAAAYMLSLSIIGLWRGVGFKDVYSRLGLIATAVKDGLSGAFVNKSNLA